MTVPPFTPSTPDTSSTALAARSHSFPRWLRIVLTVLVGLLALAGMGYAFGQLLAPLRPLRIETDRIEGVPLTIFLDAAVAPGPTVIIAHGFSGSQQLMFPFAVALARNGYTAVTFDFPGHGQNTTPLQGSILEREQRYAQLTATLDQVINHVRRRQIGNGEFALLGHSMGSEAVLRYAQIHPDRVEAVVAISTGYSAITPSNPPNVLLLTGQLEFALRQFAIEIVEQVAIGPGQAGVTYGDFREGTARRAVFVPWVEHIGVLFSPVGQRETLAWLDSSSGRPLTTDPYLDYRVLWLVLFYLAAFVFFWPLSAGFRRLSPTSVQPVAYVQVRWVWWISLAVLPAVMTPIILWLVQENGTLPVDQLLPILVGGPLALHFTLYGLLTALGLWLRWFITVRMRRPKPAQSSLGTVPPPQDVPQKVTMGIQALRQHPIAVLALTLLVIGYVFLTFGVPAQLFLLNYFPPLRRVGIAFVIFVAMLPYFLADEYLTRGGGTPHGAYAITKICFILSLVLALILDPSLFFLVIVAPLFILYFMVYGLFSRRVYQRTGVMLIGAVANAFIFAWIIAAIFPLMR